jgi:hypothetical protein
LQQINEEVYATPAIDHVVNGTSPLPTRGTTAVVWRRQHPVWCR